MQCFYIGGWAYLTVATKYHDIVHSPTHKEKHIVCNLVVGNDV